MPGGKFFCWAFAAAILAAHTARAEHARSHWAFQPLSAPALPRLGDPAPVRTPVDAFILARLQQKGLRLSNAADRATLIRRASYDLIGLPPSPDEIEAFATDDRDDAYERLVDRLLASPHFGERWGRHWLDAAGYSDITGGDNDAGIIKLSKGKWKYRDYVVSAFNNDKPYDQFLVEQLAGDELVDWRLLESFDPQTEELLVATGFLRSAADDTDEKELTTQDILHGILQRTSEVVVNNLLGLTMACAKCHDHKYEPIPQQDYYRLIAAFTPMFNPQSWVPPEKRTLADISPREKDRAEKHNAEIDTQVGALKKTQEEIRGPHERRIFATRLSALPEPIRADVDAALHAEAAKRTEVQKYLAAKFADSLKVSKSEIQSTLDDNEKMKIADAEHRIDALNGTRRAEHIQAAYDVGPPPSTYLLKRGNHETPGPTVEPGFLAALCDKKPAAAIFASRSASAVKPAGATSGRRLALALWLTDWRSPAGGLASRVMVNRVWQHLFGHGIVETSENLGSSGAEASHPELLEWLAFHFVADGRQLKPLVKLLMTSAVYRQSSRRDMAAVSSAADVIAANSDPGNRLWARMPLRRLEAEIVRDAILATSGQLDRALGGPAVPLEVRPDGMVIIQTKDQSPNAQAQRSLYVLARRHYHLSMLGVFDQPTMSTNCPNRQQSAVVLQSLTMLNDAFVLEQAGVFADRVLAATAGKSAADRDQFTFRIALGRSPSADELAWSGELLDAHAAEFADAKLPPAEHARKTLVHLCHMLLNSNEFLYVP